MRKNLSAVGRPRGGERADMPERHVAHVTPYQTTAALPACCTRSEDLPVLPSGATRKPARATVSLYVSGGRVMSSLFHEP